MNKGTANTVVLVSGGVLVALALIPGKDGGSAYKRIWAAGLLTVALGIAADFVPEVVGPFAVLVIIAAVVKNPGVIGKFVTGTPAVTAPAGPRGPVGSTTVQAPAGPQGPLG